MYDPIFQLDFQQVGKGWREIACVLRDAVYKDTETDEHKIDVLDLKVGVHVMSYLKLCVFVIFSYIASSP